MARAVRFLGGGSSHCRDPAASQSVDCTQRRASHEKVRPCPTTSHLPRRRRRRRRPPPRLLRGAGGTQPSLGELIARISENISALVRGEIDLAKAKGQRMAKEMGLGAGLLGAAGVLALFIFGCCSGR